MHSIITQAFINGKFVDSTGGTFPVLNPADNSHIADVANCTKKEVNSAIDAAAAAFKTWSKLTVPERNAYLYKLAEKLNENTDFLSKSLTKENGKRLPDSRDEVALCAGLFTWNAEEARRLYGSVIPTMTKGMRHITIRQPVGVVALILPWNYPLILLGRKIAPAIAAGCTVILKPAEDTPLNALQFAKLCEEVNLPPGVVNILPCSRDNAPEIGTAMCDSPIVRGLSFTGSTATGKWLYSRCANTVKKISLELGGNGPFIVFDSADIDLAVYGLIGIKFANSGQICICANRIYIQESIFDKFVEKFSEKIDEVLKLGNGFEEGVNVGPLINKKQLERVDRMVKDAVSKGAKLVKGGKIINETFYEPTVMTNIKPNMDLQTQEIFGPVAAFQKFKTEEEVIAAANDTEFGLAAYFYSSDVSQVWRVSEAIESGIVGVNNPECQVIEIPFGGIKQSGIGKESGKEGIEEYTEQKLIFFGNV